MDPTTTTIAPPSPLPQNPDTPPDTIINTDGSQHTQSNTSCHNINNLKSLAFKLAARMLPPHQSLIRRRFDDVFPDELIVPDHPPYSDMILTALWELKAEGGVSEEAISEFIKKEYHELPWAHATILNHHLGDLHMKGRIAMKQDRFYLCPSSVTKPIPTPTLCPSPMSSPYSSSPTSLCSSPSSSSTSFSWGPPYERPKTQRRRRRRKNPMGRGGTTVRVRGRGRGRGRTPKMIQVGQRGRSHGMIRGRKQGRLFQDNISEESQTKEEQVDDVEPEHATEEQNEVTVMEVQEDAVQDGETGFLVEDRTKVIIGQNVCGKWNENVEDKGESVGVRRSGRRKHDVSNEESLPCEQEESLPCEQAKEGTKEQGHKRKHYNVVWIGRGVRKLKEFERDLLEDESDDEVTEIEDEVTGEKDVEMIGSDAEVVEQYKQKEVKVAINVKQTRPINNQQSDIIDKQNDISGEQVELQRQSKDETHKRFHVQGQQQSESTEQDQLQNQEVQTADGQDSVTMQCEEQVIVAGVGNLNGDTVTEPIRPEERHKKCNKLEEGNQEVQTLVGQDVVTMQCETQAIIAGVGNLNDDTVTKERYKKGDKLEEENQEDQSLVEQDVVMMQCEAHAIVAGVGNLNDDTVTEEIRPEERHKKGNKLEEENQEVQTIVEQDVVMMQSEAQAIVAGVGHLNDDTVTEQIRPEERYKKGDKLEEENQEDQSLVEQDVVMMQCEAQAIVASVGNLNDDTVTEEIRPDERHKKGNKLEEENHEVQTLVKQDVVMMQCEGQAIVAGVGNLNDDRVTEQIQPEERHKKGNKVEEEIVEQDVVMMQCEAQFAGVEKQHDDTVKEQIWSEEPGKGNKSEELIHPREQCTERNKSNLRSCGQDQLQNEEAESAEERTQQGERTEGNQTEIVPVTGTEVQQNLEMHQSETQARQACVTQNESEEQQLASEKHVQPQDHCTEENKSQLHEQQQRNVIEQVQIQGEVKVAGDELQQEQPHKVVHDVSTGQQDFVITQTESEVKGDSEEHKTSEVHRDQIGIQETLASYLRPQQEGLDNAVLQEESEQRRPLRKRLRSSCTKEETTSNTKFFLKNQLELVTPPVRRSQRNHKTVPEAVGITEGPDHSKEQLQQSGRSRPSTRNSKIAEAEQSSNSRKTRSSGL